MLTVYFSLLVAICDGVFGCDWLAFSISVLFGLFLFLFFFYFYFFCVGRYPGIGFILPFSVFEVGTFNADMNQ